MKLHLMVLLLVGFLIPHRSSAQSNASALDTLLQDYAFRTFHRPRTGIPYPAKVPENLTGITITALRLKSGSLYYRGRSYNEFDIPVGVKVSPYVERLVLVYQNLGNWSSLYYPLKGYEYLAPVLGLLAYNASNLSAVNLPELDFKATRDPVLIKFSNVNAGMDVAKCVWFDLLGGVRFSNASSGNVCKTFEQGHFAIVTEVKAPKKNSKTWIIVGSVVGGAVVMIFLVLVVLLIVKIRRRRKMQQMEKASDAGEAFRMVSVGITNAPSAPRTRTPPTIEKEYVP